jgi:putative addiction module killer protein
VLDVREYVDAKGRSPVCGVVRESECQAAAKITTAVTRISPGNFSSVESIGSGVFEFKLDFGPGYRIYFGKDGEALVILLGGGTKRRQQRDINAALANWRDYKRRK